MADGFDQFPDAKPAAAADPFDAFPDAPKAGSGVAADVAKSGASGVVRGAVEGVMAPVTLPTMAAQGVAAVARKVTGTAAPSAEDRAKFEAETRSPFSFDPIVSGLRSMMDGVLHKPETTAGKYAETIGEFAPSAALGPGGLIRKSAQAVIPGVMSEAAGEATAGTAAEPWARIAAGLLGNVGVTGVTAHGSAGERAIERSVRGTDPQRFADAQRLADEGRAIGVPLTGTEAIQEVTNSGTRLDGVQRVVESSQGGGAPMARFYAERPNQVADATNRTLDRIGPASAAPQTIGPAAAEAATASIDDTRRGINAATRPAYQAAEQHVMDLTDFDPIARDPAFQASLRRLRADEVLGPQYAGAPDNSVAVIDAVTKDMQARGTALSNAANPGFQPQAAASYNTGAAEARDIARTPARGGIAEYDDALAMQEQARRQNLNPLTQGPLGEVAAATDTGQAGRALLPSRPNVGSEGATADAVTRLAAQDPELANALIRQHLADTADSTLARNVPGQPSTVGAKYANAIAGTPQQETNLRAALGAGPGGQAQDAFDSLLRVFRATGKRPAANSATAPNQQLAADLSAVPVTAEIGRAIATGGASIPGALSHLGDAAKRAWLASSTSRLADLFLAPDSASRIGAISARGAENPLLQIILREAAQAPAEARTR